MKKRNLKRRILALATCTLVLISSLMLPIGAEDASVPATETPTYTSPIDWLSYPGMNLIKPTAISQTINGVTFIVNDDKSITVKGTATGDIYYTVGTVSLSPNTYFLNGSPSDASNQKYFLYIQNNSNYDFGNGVKITISESFSTKVLFKIISGITIDTVIFPMLNVGEVAYPYQPYLPYYFQQAFDDGYENGYTEGETNGYNKGYEEGWQDLADQAQTDYINAIDLKPYLSANVYGYSNNVYYSQVIKDIPYTVTANKEIEMGQIFDYITTTLQKTDANKTWAEVVVVEFIFTYTYNNAMPTDKQFYPNTPKTGAVVIHSNSSYPHLELYELTGRRKYGTSSYENVTIKSIGLTEKEQYTFTGSLNLNSEQEALLPNIETTGFKLRFQKQKSNATNLAYNVKITSEAKVESESYRNGYYQGYLKGTEEEFSTVQEQAYKEGYATGEKNGFLAGKEEGLQITNMGSWTNLFTAVAEAPINTFQSLFSFEILGLDMRVAFGAMMSICVVLIIIKKVVL